MLAKEKFYKNNNEIFLNNGLNIFFNPNRRKQINKEEKNNINKTSNKILNKEKELSIFEKESFIDINLSRNYFTKATNKKIKEFLKKEYEYRKAEEEGENEKENKNCEIKKIKNEKIIKTEKYIKPLKLNNLFAKKVKFSDKLRNNSFILFKKFKNKEKVKEINETKNLDENNDLIVYQLNQVYKFNHENPPLKKTKSEIDIAGQGNRVKKTTDYIDRIEKSYIAPFVRNIDSYQPLKIIKKQSKVPFYFSAEF